MSESRVTPENVLAYLQGKIRYYLYYHPSFKKLIRKHVREQIDFRIKFMKKECYENGTCVLCGCTTTALQMANKSCDNPCYPSMMHEYQWELFNLLGVHRENNRYWERDGDDVLLYYPNFYDRTKFQTIKARI